MAGVESVSVVIAAASVVIGATVAVVQLRNLGRTRQAELTMQLLHRISTEDLHRLAIDVMYHQDWKDDEERREKFGPRTNPEAHARFCAFGYMWQALGLLVKRKLFDPDMIYEWGPAVVLEAWEKYEPVVEVWREGHDPTFWEAFEDLYKECKKKYELATGREYERLYVPPTSSR